MKIVFLLLACLVFSGCSYYDHLVLERYWKMQSKNYQRYISGNRSEAKKALYDMLDLAEHRGRKLKLYHGSEWEIALIYTRLALIAEDENDSAGASKFWDCAVAAEIGFEKGEIAEKPVKSDVINNREKIILNLRKFISELEKDLPIKWKKEKSATSNNLICGCAEEMKSVRLGKTSNQAPDARTGRGGFGNIDSRVGQL